MGWLIKCLNAKCGIETWEPFLRGANRRQRSRRPLEWLGSIITVLRSDFYADILFILWYKKTWQKEAYNKQIRILKIPRTAKNASFKQLSLLL